MMKEMDVTSLWIGMLAQLKQALPPTIYNTWIEPSLLPYSYENNQLILDTAQQFLRTYLSKNYLEDLKQAALAVTGTPTEIKLICSAKEPIPTEPAVAETIHITDSREPQSVAKKEPLQPLSLRDTANTIDSAPDLLIKEAKSLPITENTAPENQLDASYTFDNFIVGNSNRLAVAKAFAVADAPGRKEFNPLYIYGASGLGKTHLMHAIGHRILEKFPHMRLRSITSEDFVNEFIKCIQDKNTESFRRQYRNIDVLLVDDIQFLGRGDKDSSKEEFFHTFNKLQQDKKQIVLTSDRPPLDIERMEERLRSRFQSGSVAWIDPPDLETRTAILKTWAEKIHLSIDNESINYIAANVSENIRELSGAFNNIQVLASAEKAPVTLSMTQRAIRYLVNNQEEKKYVSTDEIINTVCQFYSVTYKDIMGKKKTKDIALPRQIAMYLCRELTEHTYPHIGTVFGGRDHTTVMHACSKISQKMNENDHFKESIDKLKQHALHGDN